nr:MAG TPA: hypothetical protein [Caudoviricetes sp.]
MATVKITMNSSYVDISVTLSNRIRTDDCIPSQLPW